MKLFSHVVDVALVEHVGAQDVAALAVGLPSRRSSRRRASGEEDVGWETWLASFHGAYVFTHGTTP